MLQEEEQGQAPVGRKAWAGGRALRIRDEGPSKEPEGQPTFPLGAGGDYWRLCWPRGWGDYWRLCLLHLPRGRRATGSTDLPRQIWSTPARGKVRHQEETGSLRAPGGLSWGKLGSRHHHGKEKKGSCGQNGWGRQGRALLCIGHHQDEQPLPRLQAMSLVSWSLPRPLRLRVKFKHVQLVAILPLIPDIAKGKRTGKGRGRSSQG